MKSSLRLLTFAACLAIASGALYWALRPRLAAWGFGGNSSEEGASAQGPGAGHLHSVLGLNLHPDDSGDRQLLMTIASLETHSSVRARIRQHARIGKHPYDAWGTYRQQGGGARRSVRWLLKSQRNEATSTLMQVSDGHRLWTVRNLASGQYIDSVDLWELRRKTNAAPAPTPAAGEASSTPLSPLANASFGGLPMLLEALRANFEFTAPRQFRMSDGTEVIGLVGRWRPEALAAALLAGANKGDSDDQKDQLSAAALRESLEKFLQEKPLPQRIPHHVLLLVGKEDLFPRLVEYRHKSDPLSDPRLEESQLFTFSSQPLAKLEFYEIEFDTPIDPDEFRYIPPVPQWRDKTTVYKTRLERAQQLRTALDEERRMANSSNGSPR
jgi:hypothetical protein